MDDSDEGAMAVDGDGEADSDPVVQEIPVYLSGQLLARHGLVLAQHPSTRRARPLDSATTLRCKPVAMRFEVDVALDPRADTYSEDTGEKLGRGIDNEDIVTAYDKQFKRDERKLLEKVTLQSILLPESTGGQYLIGALRDEEFHLTPVSSTIQLRPTLKYLDKILEKEKTAQLKIQQHELNLEQPNRKEEEPQERGVNVSVRTVEDNPDAIRRAREVDEEKRFALEEWVDLKLYNENTPEAKEMYEELFSLDDELTYSFSKHDYLESIGPKLSSNIKGDSVDVGKKGAAANAAATNTKPLWCMDDVRNLPLPALLRSLMVYANVVSFSKIMSLTENLLDPRDVLEELEKIAVLVRGDVWVVRSELLYTGRAADARRVLLGLLAASPTATVTRWDVNRLARLPYNVIMNLFVEICARVPVAREDSGGHHVDGGKVVEGGEVLAKWGLKPGFSAISVLGDGADMNEEEIASAAEEQAEEEMRKQFAELYPDVVKKQAAIVESEAERARHALEHKSVSRISAPKSGGGYGSGDVHHSGHPSKSANGSSASSVAMKEEKVSFSSIAKGKGLAVKNEPHSDTYKITGASAEAQCENLLYFALNKHGVCSGEYLQATVAFHKNVQAEKGGENHLDSNDVTPEFVQTVINGLCTQVQGRYVLKSVGSSDDFRNPIIDLFRSKKSVKKGEIMAACLNATGKNITQSMYSKIMKELANSTGPSWEFKEGPSL